MGFVKSTKKEKEKKRKTRKEKVPVLNRMPHGESSSLSPQGEKNWYRKN